MSSIQVFGLFPLSGGRLSNERSTKSTATYYYIYYRSTITCSSGKSLPAEIRIYNESSQQPLPDDTVAIVSGAVAIPPSGDVLIEANYIFPVPGDPNSDDYDDHLPDMLYPLVIVLGHVSANGVVMPDGVTRSFPVEGAGYVRGASVSSTVGYGILLPPLLLLIFLPLSCMLDKSAKWRSISIPGVSSIVQASGQCWDLTPEGNVIINVKILAFNVAGRTGVPVGGGPLPSSPSTFSPKRRKFTQVSERSVAISTSALP